MGIGHSDMTARYAHARCRFKTSFFSTSYSYEQSKLKRGSIPKKKDLVLHDLVYPWLVSEQLEICSQIMKIKIKELRQDHYMKLRADKWDCRYISSHESRTFLWVFSCNSTENISKPCIKVVSNTRIHYTVGS